MTRILCHPPWIQQKTRFLSCPHWCHCLCIGICIGSLRRQHWYSHISCYWKSSIYYINCLLPSILWWRRRRCTSIRCHLWIWHHIIYHCFWQRRRIRCYKHHCYSRLLVSYHSYRLICRHLRRHNILHCRFGWYRWNWKHCLRQMHWCRCRKRIHQRWMFRRCRINPSYLQMGQRENYYIEVMVDGCWLRLEDVECLHCFRFLGVFWVDLMDSN